MVQFAISAGLSTALSFIGTFFGKTTGQKATYAPCTKVPPSGPSDTPFILPVGAVCPAVATSYYQAYFSPASNPFYEPDGTNPYEILQNSNSLEPLIFRYKETSWSTLLPNGPLTKPFSQANIYGTFFLNKPLNLCPQKLRVETGLSDSKIEALAVPLPVVCDAKGSVDIVKTASSISLWVIPGAPLSEDVNVPVNDSATKNATAATSPFPNGLASILFIYAIKKVTLYIELGGARGGGVKVFANGVNPITGGVPLDPSYIGGNRGVVYGLYTLNENEVLKVFLGSAGQELLGPDDLPAFGGNGQSGLGTIFGGANGGGASYISHYVGPDALDKALANETKFSTLVCVAGGGGGASRNASGGSAGLTDSNFSYGQAGITNPYGSSGGKSLALGPAPYLPGLKTNDFSGGGGVETSGGQSNVTEPTEPKSSYGKRIEPFVNDGGASVVTESGSGGGGGGGGLFGGGAGGFNGLPKPNNIHGAGGGGSSWTGLLKPANIGARVSLNAYRNTTWSSIPKKGFAQSYAGYSDFGYLVIGLPTIV
jgi:hypothetical protein